MLDINFIRENTEAVKKAITDKGEKDTGVVDNVLDTDSRWRALVHKSDQLRNESNTRAKEIGMLMGQGKKEEAQVLIKQTGEMKDELKSIEDQIRELAEQRYALLLRIPNVPHPTVPVGRTEEDNKVDKTWGEPLKDSWRKPHWELAEEYGWIDFKRGVKVTGAGFPFYIGPAARLQRALINFFLDRAADKGYLEMQAPYFVNEDSARGTGQIPDKEDMMYVIPRDEFFAIPTAEVPVTNFHRDEILEPAQLPVKYCCYTPCWRREAGSYGKDVRGLNRLHQFDKVELVKFVSPDTSYDELESLRRDAEELLEALGLPYRTLLMCTGDMGFTQSKKYDLEVWSPGQQRWLEVSSCSNFESFQARRMMVRYRDDNGKPQILHTLNGSGLALPRVMSAVLEAYQEESGKIRVPEVLKAYLKNDYLG
ncbi:MAG: serine--tRNA ligase [Balneolaceae bacterium]|nr:MAG: serine--tRNA ligase [Balneolaceae bacterium]